MHLKPLTSATIHAVGYAVATQTLRIIFRSGAVYEYVNVPESVYVGLLRAPSHGAYFSEHIRPAGYEFREVM
ncbi:MAG: KTSC domain-containing protein [Hymenobacteraceae bacterium]|nr:KTSC domain-containing protein [Hymenobacteraceae bacterium]